MSHYLLKVFPARVGKSRTRIPGVLLVSENRDGHAIFFNKNLQLLYIASLIPRTEYSLYM